MAEETLEDIDPLDPQDVAAHEALQQNRVEIGTETLQKQLRDRRDAYVRFFGGLGGSGDRRLVMEDLRAFCRGGETAWHEDPRVHALLTGRQEVYRRISDHLELDFDDLWARYNRKPT